ncbi:MAG: PilZ domain-containing protein [Nitrospinota bacterium]
MPEKTGNKRKFSRVNFIIDLDLATGGSTLHYDRTHDISMGGIFVKTDEALKVGTEGAFTIVLSPGEDGVSIKGKFRVASIFDKGGAKGMGLNFTEIEPNSSVELYRVIKFNSHMQDA